VNPGADHRERSSIPPLPVFHVARPKLLDLIDRGADRPLTLVIAPPVLARVSC
jgi:hypothetical protein